MTRSLVAGLAMTLLCSSAATFAADKLPADDLSGPPFVSAKGWAIVDGKTGEFLWGYQEDEGFKSASTTKIMCAHVVLELAKQDPSVLDEIVTFSELADNTSGSTADIRVGESISVKECLYGLLLPSGNDAGNALGEHFNARLAPSEDSSLPTTSRSNFVAEMNRQAAKIGLKNTVYRSTFGDGGTENDRTTTPRDLLKLSWTAMQNPKFREYVGTIDFATTVRTPDGGTRDVSWKNTNQLLPIEGFDGIKTGTTNQAGSCVVSSGHRGDDHLMVVVLGSTTNEGRYIDSKNLYRWAWLKRGHNATTTAAD